MRKINKILVPIDFSDCSENALIYAMQLADEIGANLLVLNVPPFDTSNMESPLSASFVVEEQISLSRRRLIKSVQKATESIRSTLDKNPSIQTNIEVGRVEATICDAAVKNQVDYIILGTQGENSTLDKYLGSVASNVLKNAPCPVMVIPKNTKFGKKVVMGYATDFLDADPFEIWKAVKLFKPFQPKIKCVHFNEKESYNEDKIKELEAYFSETAPELKVEFYSLPAKDKVKDMNKFIEEQNINMLVMYKPKRTFFESIFHKSYTQKMAKHTTIPLLIFKEIK
jgi:nucleotide-binding universal stress UspA family protein